MDLMTAGGLLAERAPIPDAIITAGMRHLISGRERDLSAADANADAEFAAGMVEHPIAEHAAAANEQHYELPPEFFALILGPRASTHRACMLSGRRR